MFDYLKKILEQVREISQHVDDYKKLSPSGAMPSVALVNKAVKLLNQNKRAEAEALLLEAAELYPANEAVFKTLGAFYESSKEFEKAAVYFQKALTLNPIKKDLFMRLGFAQLSARLNEEARKTFERGKNVFKSDADIITGYGMALYRLERFEEARVEFVKAFAIDSHNMNALFLTATIDIMFGDYERAETRLSLLVKVAPGTAHLYEYAKLKKLKADYESAEALAKRAIDTNKNFLPAYLLLAEIYNAKFDVPKALEWIQKAEDNELYSASLYMARANIYMFQEDFASALESYKKVLEYEQDKSTDMKILICEILLGNLEGKETAVEALTFDVEQEENKEIKSVEYMLKGVWNYKTGNLIAAEENFRKALQITLKLPAVYYLLAKIYEADGDNYKTEKYFELTIEKTPHHLQAYKDFIEYYLKQENFTQARFKIKKALKLFPENPYFENLLFHTGFRLLNENSSDYNVKELLKLAEKLEKNSTFLYADEKNILLEKFKG